MNWIIKNFLRGLVIVVPIGLTVYLIVKSFLALDRLLRLPYPGVGALIVIVAVIVVGALASNIVFRFLLDFTHMIFTKAPIVRIIYAAIKDLLEAFVGNKRRFDKPVIVSLTPDVKVFGFVTREELGALAEGGDVAVYIPFSYTWDGCLLVVPREHVRRIDADSASVMALVMSGGVSTVSG